MEQLKEITNKYVNYAQDTERKIREDAQRLSTELQDIKKVHLDLPYLKNMFINYVSRSEEREVGKMKKVIVNFNYSIRIIVETASCYCFHFEIQ